MSFLVICTFDLKNASRTDYDNAYSDLETIGLKKVVISSQGSKIVAPTTMTLGEFEGASVGEVRDDIRDRVKAAFNRRVFKSEIFVVAAGNWAWGAAST